ncbi:DUF3365 domain-containing protein [Arcobacter sp. LA11]|uniref:ATP-binding protein n=1 Tax=Arcobacter sp. LA11 TaxID=1898176 RepID=UPI000934015A|nr:DUF3365 domain-containing protein [Arcobacter sp. LA11]
MQKYTKIFIIFAILTINLIGLKFYLDIKDIKELKNMVVKDEAKALTALFLSFRETYQNIFIEKHIQIDEKTINLLPVRTNDAISSTFSKIVGDKITIRTVSDRPRNIKNKANNNEMNIIDFFNKNSDKESYFKAEENATFYYAQPLYITDSCLKCHGKKTEALETIRDRYDNAYNYKIGDLRGIVSIKVTKKDIVEKIDNNFYRDLKTTIILYILFLIAIYLIIRIIIKNEQQDANILKNKVDEQVKQLREQDNTLLQQSKMAEMGEMIGNIAHQWRQPLSAISTSASGIKLKNEFDTLDDDYLNGSLDSIVKSTQYLSQTIDDFRNFIKGDKDKRVFKLSDNIHTDLEILKGMLKHNEIKIELEIEENLEIESYPNELTQIIINIVNNSKDALTENKIKNKYIFINAKKIENKYIQISIRDNANGIPLDIIDKIFDPYFTTKHQSQGTGLGLYMTHRIVKESLKGEIAAKNITFNYEGENYTGAEFIIKLPHKIK